MTKKKSAVVSKCSNYRYLLERVWDEYQPKVGFIMLNPSKADELQDDPTIRRCINFAKSWGYGGILVGNIFAFRETDPKKMFTASDPVGPDNQKYLKHLYNEVEVIVCAWGSSFGIPDKIKVFSKKLYYLDLQKDGTPKHPLYLKSSLIPKPLNIIL